jgi:penicillin-binding protein 1A
MIHRPGSTIAVIMWLGWTAVCGAVLSLAGAFLYLNPQIPDAESYRHVKLETPLRIYAADGALIAEFGERRVIPVNLEDVPPLFVSAILNTEDKRFYSHRGIDWISLLNDTRALLLTRQIGPGASTITMQLARNISFSLEQTFIRKFKEMLLALKIERELTKDEILELYINAVPFGKRAYGAQAAAYTYYGKPLGALELEELAMLAGIPQAPSVGNPINGPERALNRRNLVLYRMFQEGSISEHQYHAAMAQPSSAALHERELDVAAPYVGEWVRQELVRHLGPDIYTGGYEVVTTIDTSMQAAATRALREGLLSYDRRHGYRGPEASVDLAALEPRALTEVLAPYSARAGLEPALVTAVDERRFRALRRDGTELEIDWEMMRWARRYVTVEARGPAPRSAADIVSVGDVVRLRDTGSGWALAQWPEIQGAIVAIEPNTGAVKTLVGGFDFFARQYNHALQATRQPGSAFKPFIFSAALERGYSPASIFLDAPLVFDDENLEAAYRPQNFGGRYYGPVSLRDALARSMNLVSMRVLMAIGARNAIDYSGRFGFDTSSFPRNTQLALGGGTMGVTPMQMAVAYSVFANGGHRIEPHIITAVKTLAGNVVFAPRHPVVCIDCARAHGGSNAESIDGGVSVVDIRTLDAVPDTDVGDLLEVHPPGDVNAEPPAGEATMPIVAERVVDERNAFIINNMLQDAMTRGTGRRAQVLERTDIAGKTGTTDEADTWFIGYQRDLVGAVWVGFGDNRPLGSNESGSNLPLPIWIDLMQTALAGVQEAGFSPPPGIVTMRVNPATGEIAEAGNETAVFEYFLSEHAPGPRAPARGGRAADRDSVRPVDIF